MALYSTETSNLQFYSVAIVAEDKPISSDVAVVTPIEKLHTFNGQLKEYEVEHNVTLPDSMGNEVTENITSKATIEAKWVNLGNSNRHTAPDLYMSETVLLYKFSDDDQYYWSTIFRPEPKLRKSETVVYAYSNIPPSQRLTDFDQETSYWVKVDTRNKVIHLHTPNNDGEPFIYDITLDTGKGIFVFKDLAGSVLNFIEFNSSKCKIEAKAIEEIEFHTKKFTVNSEEVLFRVKNQWTVQCPSNDFVKGPGDPMFHDPSGVTY
jgi:hypothetical protein